LWRKGPHRRHPHPRRHEREQVQRHWADRVRDIVVASKECLEFTSGMTLEQFAADLKTQKAVLMNLVIIGEAAKFTPGRIVRQHPAVAWEDMRELRNFVVHVYFRVEPRLVWETVHRELPAVARRLEAILADRNPPGRP
jgi:uncharacterized protein